jgi:hypothetical protein
MWKAVTGFLALALLVLAGCGSSSPATPSAQAQFCQSLTSLHSSVNELTDVNGNTTVGEVKSYGQSVAAAMAQVRAAAANLHTARISDLNSAVNNLQQTINTLPNSTTLSEAASTIQSQAAAVQTARAQVGTQAGCSTSTTTP